MKETNDQYENGTDPRSTLSSLNSITESLEGIQNRAEKTMYMPDQEHLAQ